MKIMKRLSTAVKALRGFEDYDDQKWLDYTGGGITKAGLRINEVNSLSISAIYSAINIIAGTIASIPKAIYRELKSGGKEKAKDHPLYDRLHNKPNNSNMTSWQWIFSSLVHKYLWGNWYTQIDTKSYRDRELIPLLPDRTYLDPEKKDRYVTMEKGKTIYIAKEKILHIPHFSLDGISGKGVIHYARESLGISKALDEFAGSFFGSGIHPGGFVEIAGGMEKETRNELQKDFNEKYRGLGKLFSAIFLTGGAKWNKEEIDPERAQALQSRQFSVIEVSRWMNLPPHIMRELSRATYSNIEQQGIELVIYSFLPLTSQIEQAMNIAFFDDEERKDHYVKFELKGLLRGDIQARTEFYKAMLDRGVYNADQVLDLEDENPQPDGLGKIYHVPLNMINKELIMSPQPLTIENKSAPIVVKRDLKPAIQQRSAALRRKITISYKSLFDEYGKKIVKKEVDAIRGAIEEMLSQKGIVDFNNWLENYYRDFGKEIDKHASPLISSYAAAVLPVAQDEINSDFDISPQYQDFQREYKDYFTARHIKSSQGQLGAVIRDAQEAGENEAEALEQRLTEWEEKRPGKITMRETIRAESAFARSVFALSGISKIRSIAYGTNCPYCQALDGKVIGIDDFFLTKGDFQPEGAKEPLKVTSNRSHPSYHEGCDCGIMASI